MKTVIEMAREAGFVVCRDESVLREMLERFAELVRKDYSFTHAQMWLKRFDDAVKAEREACAGLRKEVELRGKWPSDYEDGFLYALEKYEDMIRKRNNT